MTPTVADIQFATAVHYQVDLADMKSDRRAYGISHPRQMAMYLARKKTARSYPEIGKLFGGRDHSTVIHAYNRVRERIRYDEEARNAARLIAANAEERAKDRSIAHYWGA
jgi:chromosomal replication initiator protein